MQNFLLTKPDKEIEELSKRLGFEKTLFLDQDFVLLKGEIKKLRKEIDQAKSKKKIVIYQPNFEEDLRYALEHTPVDMVIGIEKVHPKDSLHYPRAGLDQVLCNLARENDKIIAFSFEELLNSNNLPKLLNRMAFNLKLCHKYKINVLFSNFSKDFMEMRAPKELIAVWELLGGISKEF